jgi:hypothetical protein
MSSHFLYIIIRALKNLSLRKTTLGIPFIVMLLVIYVFSIPTVEAKTVEANSCSRADIQTAINFASNGDTVNVPAGSASWSSPISVDKDLSIIAAGKTKTSITLSNNDAFVLSNEYNIRISGFGFKNATIRLTDNPVDGKSFRIDHNSFTSSTWLESFLWSGGPCSPASGTARMPTGLIDNNEYTNHRLLPMGTNCNLADGNYQHQLWARTPPKGKGTEVVYIENNVFNNSGNPNVVDSNYGGRYVFRFNTVSGTGGTAEIHSVQGANRSAQWVEIYKNTHTRTQSAWFPFLYYRGGTALVWGNRISNSTFDTQILMNNVRSCRDPGGTDGKCSGSSDWDQNLQGKSGYGCRDQIGRSYDQAQWYVGAAYTQPLTPSYLWDNALLNGNQMEIDVNAGESCGPSDLNNVHIVANRDYYSYTASFNGTAGVGVGTLANRPATCTPGVSYWATDQGNWNESGSGGQGVLYKCVSQNKWELYYTPYTYPHPLTKGDSIPPDEDDNTPPGEDPPLSAPGTPPNVKITQ